MAEKQVLDLATLQADHGMHVAATRLNDEQLREAEAAFHRLEGRTRSLSFYLNYALTNDRDPARDMSVADAAKRYLDIPEADYRQQNLSHRQFTSFRCELRALQAVFPKNSRQRRRTGRCYRAAANPNLRGRYYRGPPAFVPRGIRNAPTAYYYPTVCVSISPVTGPAMLPRYYHRACVG